MCCPPFMSYVKPKPVCTVLLAGLLRLCSCLEYPSEQCRTLPQDAGWPSQADWANLNKTVGGRLIATVPVASVCHDPNYDEELCDQLKQDWLFPQPHVMAPADILDPYFQNQTCDPYTPREQPCTLGNYAVYSINVSSVSDIQAGIAFARANNIRLTIKNTGHDLLGKSTGRGALSLWTHNLAAINFVDAYVGDTAYNGTAVRLGAGVMTQALLSAAASKGVRVITGTCDTVGVAGGYTAGGGHGSLTSLYGMAADSVLEWEVVTAAGEHLIATPKQHADLFWALSGGGAGTFAVIVTLTTRTYVDGPMQGARFSLTASDPAFSGSLDAFWDAVETFHSGLTPLVDAGGVMTWELTNSALEVFAIVLPGSNPTIINTTLRPVVEAMQNKTGAVLTISSTSHNSWWDLYQAYFLPVLAISPNGQISGGRLLPRTLLEDPSSVAGVMKTLREATEGGFVLACGAINANNTSTSQFPDTAVFPVWRSTLVQCIVIRTWNYSLPWDINLEFQRNLTRTVMPAIEAATPGGGSYLNEANFEQLNWQEAFYGSNYPRLQAVKAKYDPANLFYARTAVGSEAWAEDSEQRLCKT